MDRTGRRDRSRSRERRDPFSGGARRDRTRSRERRDRDRGRDREPQGDPFAGPAPTEKEALKAMQSLSSGNPFKNKESYEAQKMIEELGMSEAPPQKGDPFSAAMAPDAKKDADPFGAFMPAGAGAKPDGWTEERAKLEAWEKGGNIAQESKPELGHLKGFMNKDGAPAPGAASAAAQAMAEEQRKRAREDDERVVIKEPCFDDANADEFACDGCKVTKRRADFSAETLAVLGDCLTAREANDAPYDGPYRGMLVRIHDRGFGFIDCPQLTVKHGRDVFLHAGTVERVLGGRMQARAAVQEKLDQMAREDFGAYGRTSRPYARLQFKVQYQQRDQHELVAREPVDRIQLLCKACEQRRKRREQAKQLLSGSAMVGAGALVVGGKGPANPVFDPKARMAQLLGKFRSDMNLPQPGKNVLKNSFPMRQ